MMNQISISDTLTNCACSAYDTWLELVDPDRDLDLPRARRNRARGIPPKYELVKESELRESPYIIDTPQSLLC